MHGQRFLIVAVLLILAGVPGVAPAAQDLEIHFTTYFENSSVQVKLDDYLVFDGLATTDLLLGLALVVRTTANPGPHSIEVNAGGFSRSLQFELLENTYVLVSRDPVTDELGLRVGYVQPIYE